MNDTIQKNDTEEGFKIFLCFCVGLLAIAMILLFLKINNIKKDLDQIKEDQYVSMLEKKFFHQQNTIFVPFADPEKIYCDGEGPFGLNCFNKQPLQVHEVIQFLVDQSGLKYQNEKISTTPARLIK